MLLRPVLVAVPVWAFLAYLDLGFLSATSTSEMPYRCFALPRLPVSQQACSRNSSSEVLTRSSQIQNTIKIFLIQHWVLAAAVCSLLSFRLSVC